MASGLFLGLRLAGGSGAGVLRISSYSAPQAFTVDLTAYKADTRILRSDASFPTADHVSFRADSTRITADKA